MSADWREPVNLYIVTALPPGERKSAVFRETMGPLERLERQEMEDALPEIRSKQVRKDIAIQRAERLQKDASRKADPSLVDEAIRAADEAAHTEVPALPRRIADDTTPEALASLIADHERIAILSAEGGIFDTLAGRYSGGIPNIDVFLKGHSGDDLRVDRRGRPPEYIRQPAITLGLAVQPDVIRPLAGKPGFRGRGLIARCLFSLPSGRVGYRETRPAAMSDHLRRQYEAWMMEIGRLDAPEIVTGGPYPLTLSREGGEMFDDFVADLEPRLRTDGDLGHIADWASKLAGATARVAGLLHVANHLRDGWGKPISVDTIRAAIVLAHYFTAHAKAAFDLMGADAETESARHVLAWIEGKEVERFTQRQAFEALKGRFKKVSRLQPALRLLAEHEYILRLELAPEQRVGRPQSATYVVNPHIHRARSQNSQKASFANNANANSGGGA